MHMILVILINLMKIIIGYGIQKYNRHSVIQKKYLLMIGYLICGIYL